MNDALAIPLLVAERKARFWGLIILALSLLFARGTYVLGLAIVAFALILRLLGPERNLCPLPAFRWTLGFVLFLWGAGLCPNLAQYLSSGSALLYAAILMASLGLPMELPSRWPDPWKWLGLALLAFVIFHLIGDFVYRGPAHRGYPGFFRNIHYLSGYVVLTLPLVVVLMMRERGWLRTLYGLVLLLDLGLLLASKSRPGFMAMGASILVLVPFLPGPSRWRLLGGALIGFGLPYLMNWFDFATRINEFLAHITEDERAEIWAGAMTLIERNTPLEWGFGHGLGQFLIDYHDLSLVRQTKGWNSPHNFGLEILYSHGVLGLSLSVAAMAGLFWALIRSISSVRSQEKTESLMFLAILTGLLTHGAFTIPFFSRDFLLPFVLISGFFLRRMALREMK